MASTYNYAGETMKSASETIPSNLKPNTMVDDDFLRSRGLYSKSDIEEAKYKKFSRYGRIINPYGRLNDCREYLFFVKPDLHIVENNYNSGNSVYNISGRESRANVSAATSANFYNDGMRLNPQLYNNAYFMDLLQRYPNVVKELQVSATSNGKKNDPFCHLLSFCVNGHLELPSSEASTLDTPATILGTNYEYLKDAMESDENPSFTLDFLDTKDLECYNFFKAYAEYHKERKSGLVTPPHMDYYRYRMLHNTMGIYKFIVGEDMETIIYYAYLYGVYPVSFPREAFGDPLFSDGLTFSVSFKAAFIEDYDPKILKQFNNLMMGVMNHKGLNQNKWIPVVRQNHTDDTLMYDSSFGTAAAHSYDTSIGAVASKETIGGFEYQLGAADMIDATLPVAALVDGRNVNGETKRKYRLRWYA